MILRPFLIGVFASVLVILSRMLWKNLSSVHAYSFFGVLLVLLLLWIGIRFLKKQAQYSAFAQLIKHVHTSPSAHVKEQWGFRGLISFLLSLFGGIGGMEGSAIEWSQGVCQKIRNASSRWSEHRRRTDAAVALAGGVAAAFNAPLAAILLPMELGIGGRATSIVLSAVGAVIGLFFLEKWVLGESYSLVSFATDHSFSIRSWVDFFSGTGLLILSIVLVALFTQWLIQFSRRGLDDLFSKKVYSFLFVGVLIVLVGVAFPDVFRPTGVVLSNALASEVSVEFTSLSFLARFLVLVLFILAFGGAGVVWPVFLVGALLGMSLEQLFPGFSGVLTFAGGGVLLGALLGTPVAGALLAFEMTDSFYVLSISLISGLMVQNIFQRLKVRHFHELELRYHGVELESGRSKAVLEKLLVKDSMVTEFTVVSENSDVDELYENLSRARYPFLVVCHRSGKYVGLLTADLIEDAWQANQELTHSGSRFPLSQLLEAKDLLFRSRTKIPYVFEGDSLSVTSRLFEKTPVIPVVNESKHVKGLLFAFNVRIAYDREVSNQALARQHQFEGVTESGFQKKSDPSQENR